MKIEDVRVVYRNDGSYCGPISVLKRLDDDDLALVFREADWRGVRTHGDPTTRTSLVRSSDGGETWGPPVTVDPDGGNGTALNQLSDGSLIVNNFRWVFAPPDRKEELSGKDGLRDLAPQRLAMALDGVFTVRSRDRGLTWKPPRRMQVPGFTFQTTAGRVIELEDGSLLIPMNGILEGGTHQIPWVARSTDGGETWSRHGVCGTTGNDFKMGENRILLLPSGRVLSMVRTNVRNYYRSYSDDGGATWSASEETEIPCRGSSPADLLLLDDGRVLCTYASRRVEPIGVRACLSEDGGLTWNAGNPFILRFFILIVSFSNKFTIFFFLADVGLKQVF